MGAWLKDEELNSSAIGSSYIPAEPLPKGVSLEFLSTYLQKYGYDIEPTWYLNDKFNAALNAFKSHFSCNQNPGKYDSSADENDMLWIWGLVAKYPRIM